MTLEINRPSVPLLCTLTLALASTGVWSQSAGIERSKPGDNELSCAQLHGEMADMTKTVTEAKEAQEAGSQTATAGSAGKVAAEVAGQTGLFGRFGGIAGSLFGKATAKAAADSAQQSGQSAMEQAAERARQASVRKDYLAGVFSERGCQADNLAHNPPAVAVRPVAQAAEAPVAKRALRNVEPVLPDVDPDAHFQGKMGGTFGKNVTELLPAYKRVAIAGFRVAFVTKDSATAQVRASYLPGRDRSGARVTVNASLAGVDGAAMQAIADKAYANFETQLKLAGREVVPTEELKEFWSGLQPTISSAQAPFSKEVGTQTLQLFSPSTVPLWFIHAESGWSDRGGFDLANWRRLGDYSKKLNAIVVTPLVVVNFVSMASSGNQSGLVAREASADAIPGMNVQVFMSLYNSPVDEGGVQMRKGFASDIEYGSMKEVTNDDNKAVKGFFDTLGAAAGFAGGGGSARASSNRVMQAKDTDYRVAAEDVLAKATGTFAKLFQKYPAP